MHFTVLVVIPDRDEQIQTEKQLTQAVSDALEPFSEHKCYQCRDDCESCDKMRCWDWWLIGGRWTGIFDVQEGIGFSGEPGVDTDPNLDPNKADAVRNKYLTGNLPKVAVVLQNGVWNDLQHGYYPNDWWDKESTFRAYTEAHPNDWFVVVDCHT